MINKIFVITIAIVFVGVAVAFFVQDDNTSRVNTNINESEGDLSQVNFFESKEEYVVDDSDMYVIEDFAQNRNVEILTKDEEDWLIFMREEEKLARDVYITLGDIWGVNIFSNIANSEQTHTDSVKSLLIKYNVDDPVKDDAVGVFTNSALQKLFDDLKAQGESSLVEALIVGATIEDLDINDLDMAITESNKSDIKTVYQNLQKGSRNHLRAFVRQIERNGGEYLPQYISVSDYENIIISQQERGRIN